MTYVACIVSACPMRESASHRSEMVSQLLFGEYAEVLKKEGDFTLVKNLYDNYEGWCQSNQLYDIEHKLLSKPIISYTTGRKDFALMNDVEVPLSIGTPIFKGKKIKIGRFDIKYKTKNKELITFDEELMKGLAMAYLHVPYLWGGRSSFGIDCSGFTQQVYKMMGKTLFRDASQQATQGEDIGFLQEARCGDLAFFDNEEGVITHVGILLSTRELIHASGRVRIDKIDTEGVVNMDTGKRTHRLRMIRRFFIS